MLEQFVSRTGQLFKCCVSNFSILSFLIFEVNLRWAMFPKFKRTLIFMHNSYIHICITQYIKNAWEHTCDITSHSALSSLQTVSIWTKTDSNNDINKTNSTKDCTHKADGVRILFNQNFFSKIQNVVLTFIPPQFQLCYWYSSKVIMEPKRINFSTYLCSTTKQAKLSQL